MVYLLRGGSIAQYPHRPLQPYFPSPENAVRLAMEKLILPELGHLVKELTK